MPAGGRPFQFAMWGKEVPEVQPGDDCPMAIEPRGAVVPKHGMTAFQASIAGRLAGLHKYRFVAKGKYAKEMKEPKKDEVKEETGWRAAAPALPPLTGESEVRKLPMRAAGPGPRHGEHGGAGRRGPDHPAAPHGGQVRAPQRPAGGEVRLLHLAAAELRADGGVAPARRARARLRRGQRGVRRRPPLSARGRQLRHPAYHRARQRGADEVRAALRDRGPLRDPPPGRGG